MTGPALLLEVRDLCVDFAGRGHGGGVRAVDGVSLRVGAGETLGLVGESGSGKSTLGNAVLGLVPPTAGRILFAGQDITHARPAVRRQLAQRLQAVFQDPYGSLNPSRTIGATLAEPLRVHRRIGRAQAAARLTKVLAHVGLPPDAASRYPQQFSGGQRQRIAIARALVLDPELVICDEPTSALDLSVQAQILNLLLALQQNLGLAYLFISHDIDVVKHMAHRVGVLLKGRLVEEGLVEQVTVTPRHQYTRNLLAAALAPDPAERGEHRQDPWSATPSVAPSEPLDLA